MTASDTQPLVVENFPRGRLSGFLPLAPSAGPRYRSPHRFFIDCDLDTGERSGAMVDVSVLEGQVQRLSTEVRRLKQLVATLALTLCDHGGCEELEEAFDRTIEWASVEFDLEVADELLPVLPKVSSVRKVLPTGESPADRQRELFADSPEPDG
ncbi:MAG: hypothetical protein WD069_21615 [Planctomycetales bacterium]